MRALHVRIAVTVVLAALGVAWNVWRGRGWLDTVGGILVVVLVVLGHPLLDLLIGRDERS